MPAPNILIIKPSSFGDIVHGLQVAETIRRGVPGAHIAWVAASAFAPLVRVCDTVDEVFEFRRDGGVAGFLQLIRMLRRTRFDYVLDMQGLARSALIARLSRGAMKIGRRDGREGARVLCPRTVALPPGGLPAHAVEVLLQFAPIFGLPPRLEGKITFSRAPRPRDLALMTPWPGPALLFFPESRRAEKNWPGFATLAKLLLARVSDLRIFWSGRMPVGLETHLASGRFVDAGRSRLALDELPAVFERVDWVISNDSGPMHLAAAMDVRAFGIFGPTDPARFGPWPPRSERHRVVRAPGGDLRRLEPEMVAEVLIEAADWK
ncbi:MAG: glycosyltransferase family 9 protein [Opitutaceae bacterium]